MPDQKILLNRPEIAHAYGVSQRQIQHWENDYQFPVVKIGGRCLYDVSACREWHRQFVVGGVPAPAQEKVEA